VFFDFFDFLTFWFSFSWKKTRFYRFFLKKWPPKLNNGDMLFNFIDFYRFYDFFNKVSYWVKKTSYWVKKTRESIEFLKNNFIILYILLRCRLIKRQTVRWRKRQGVLLVIRFFGYRWNEWSRSWKWYKKHENSRTCCNCMFYPFSSSINPINKVYCQPWLWFVDIDSLLILFLGSRIIDNHETQQNSNSAVAMMEFWPGNPPPSFYAALSR